MHRVIWADIHERTHIEKRGNGAGYTEDEGKDLESLFLVMPLYPVNSVGIFGEHSWGITKPIFSFS